jgi:hypothetical protein
MTDMTEIIGPVPPSEDSEPYGLDDAEKADADSLPQNRDAQAPEATDTRSAIRPLTAFDEWYENDLAFCSW